MSSRMAESNYVIAVYDSPRAIDSRAWNELLAMQSDATPFMRHEYLDAMQESDSATPSAGWTARFICLWRDEADGSGSSQPVLEAACALYLKDHSYGEYVFDHAWANAYHQHGLAYYPKALVAPPFTPVPGTRLLARDAGSRKALVEALIGWCREQQLSSLHVLFASDADAAACSANALMLRHNVQFHWTNRAEDAGGMFASMDAFLATLSQDKRKKIRQERRKVADAGVSFRWGQGHSISTADWDVFYRCYERTYYEHGNAPYLTRDFFQRMATCMPENWLLFVAERRGSPIACSLIALSDATTAPATGKVAYGRYWGALERVDCLHFEACYYQPLQWCIAHGFQRFEGGAQGEHKMARALLPVKTTSAHWLAHPAFADAVDKFLQREGRGIDNYMNELEARNPFRAARSSQG